MKFLITTLLFLPFALAAQNVGIHTSDPQHPFQVNVDSTFTEIVLDQSIPGFSQGYQLIVPAAEKGAQQITVGQTGRLSGIELKFISVTEVDEVLVEAFRGAGPGGVLMTSKSLFDVVNGVYVFEFPQPWPEVTIGEMINIVVSPGPGESLKWNKYINDIYPGGTAYHYNGTWTALAFDLYLKSFVEVQDTAQFDVLRVQSDRMVGINNYLFPRHDGQAGDVIQTNGNGTLTWSSPDMLNIGVLEDTDHDTKVEVEATPDDDIIRMKVGGQQKMTILPNGKVGLNTLAPVSDLDIRGDNDETDGGEFQLATPSMSNFIRMFGGRLGDPHPFIAFSDQDHFHFVTTASDWSTFTRRLTITPSGKIGIGTDQPTALLQVNNGAVLFKGPPADLPGTPADPPANGAGTRMMWYPDKAAFRVGRVTDTAWDKDSIGLYSFAGGVNNKAKGIFGFVGSGEGGNYAIGTHSFVGNGRDNIAFGDYSFIGGGNDHTATGVRSFVGGGSGNTSSGQFAAIVGGDANIASGDYAFIGSGPALFARSYGESVFGTYATDYSPMSPTSFHDADRLFVIGSGTSNADRKDAFTIFKNGSIGVGTSAPENRIHVEGSTTSSQHILSVQNNYSGNVHIRAVEGTSTPANGFGIGGYFSGGWKGIEAVANGGSFSGTVTGVEGIAHGTDGTHVGIYGKATGGMTNWAGYFANGNVKVENDLNIEGEVGIGTFPSNAKLKIEGRISSISHVLQVSSNYSGNAPIRAVEGTSVPAGGYGHGGYFTGGASGVSGKATGSNFSGTCIGVDGYATGTTGIRIGINGNASGGTTNWAGYFDLGNVYIANELRIGPGAQTGATGYKVAIDGKLIAEEVRVQLSGDWPDYVFKHDYPLLPLDEVDQFIKANGHLPGMPSAAQVESEGHLVGEIQIQLLEKIEELTLHLIQMQKQNKELIQRISMLEGTLKNPGE